MGGTRGCATGPIARRRCGLAAAERSGGGRRRSREGTGRRNVGLRAAPGCGCRWASAGALGWGAGDRRRGDQNARLERVDVGRTRAGAEERIKREARGGGRGSENGRRLQGRRRGAAGDARAGDGARGSSPRLRRRTAICAQTLLPYSPRAARRTPRRGVRGRCEWGGWEVEHGARATARAHRGPGRGGQRASVAGLVRKTPRPRVRAPARPRRATCDVTPDSGRKSVRAPQNRWRTLRGGRGGRSRRRGVCVGGEGGERARGEGGRAGWRRRREAALGPPRASAGRDLPSRGSREPHTVDDGAPKRRVSEARSPPHAQHPLANFKARGGENARP